MLRIHNTFLVYLHIHNCSLGLVPRSRVIGLTVIHIAKISYLLLNAPPKRFCQFKVSSSVAENASCFVVHLLMLAVDFLKNIFNLTGESVILY